MPRAGRSVRFEEGFAMYAYLRVVSPHRSGIAPAARAGQVDRTSVIAADGAGNTYVTGWSTSIGDFPHTSDAF
jgi:hypothetical protein